MGMMEKKMESTMIGYSTEAGILLTHRQMWACIRLCPFVQVPVGNHMLVHMYT